MFRPSFLLFLTLALLTSCKKPTEPPLLVGPDTTSHDYVWTVDTVGVFQSALADVWGSSASDVYAVGRIARDSGVDYNAIHFDGTNWTPFYIMFASNPGTIGPPELHGVFGFSSSDVWAVGVGGVVAHFDGSSWNTICLGIGENCSGLLPNGEMLFEVWGTSSSDLYAVGDLGAIVHYDGRNWTKMASGTVLPLQAVWGSSSTNVYATGIGFGTALWTVVQYDGTMWKDITVDQAPLNSTTGIWGSDWNDVYVVGDFADHFDGSNWMRISVPDTLYTMHGVGGSASNNVFIVGSFGVVMHWNGVSWRSYDGLLDPYSQNRYVRVWTDGRTVFVVGYTSSYALIARGTRQN